MKNSLVFILAVALPLCIQSVTMESMEVLDGDALKSGYKFHHPIPSDQNNPWISGPSLKKYQFHVGQQSWLSARESCLSQNSDLVTIQSNEEMDWILTHYKPQGHHLRERQIQIGLLVDSNPRLPVVRENMRKWRWVNRRPINASLMQWTSGEPFDHALGKERCALLNVNERMIDDIDCDLGGTPTHFYRYICERTHENHLKHEELNNPLWKKLEDILVFFGISEPSTSVNKTEEAAPVEDEEDYWENGNNPSKKAVTLPSVSASTSLNASEDEAKEDTVKADETKSKVTEKTVEPAKEVELAPVHTSNSTSDSTLDEKDLLSTSENKAIELENSVLPTENDTTTTAAEQSPAGNKTIVESDSSRKDAAAEIIASIGTNSSTGVEIVRVESPKTPLIVIAHAAKTVVKTAAENDTSSSLLIEKNLEKMDRNEHDELSDREPKRLIEQKTPELIIANDLSELETASVETTRTTKADPLARLADTLERTFASVSSDDANSTVDGTSADGSGLKSSTKTQSRIHSLERILTAVQKMIETEDKPWKPSSDQSVREQVVLNTTESTIRTKIIRLRNETLEEGTATDSSTNSSLSSSNAKLENGVESALNVEEDFIQAVAESKSHPDVNSGDLIVKPKNEDDDIAGSCGDPSHHDHGSARHVEIEADNSELIANDTEKAEQTAKIDKFLHSLREFLDTAPPTQLKKLVDDGKTDKSKPLIQRLEEVVAMRKQAKQEGSNHPSLPQPTPKTVKEENPADLLKKLHANKLEQEKIMKIDAELAADIEKLSKEEALSKKEDEDKSSSNAHLQNNGGQKHQQQESNSSSPTAHDYADSTLPPSRRLDNLHPVKIQTLQAYSAINHLGSPTQDIIDAVVALQNNPQILPILNIAHDHPASNGTTNELIEQKSLNESQLVVTVESSALNETKESLEASEKTQPNIHNALIETEDPSAVFPRPNFTLLNSNETQHLPKEVEERIKAEQKRVGTVYNNFLSTFKTVNGGKLLATATNDFIRRIQEADSQRLTVRQSPSIDVLPTNRVELSSDPEKFDAERHGIVIEKGLSSMFDAFGDNFNKLIGKK